MKAIIFVFFLFFTSELFCQGWVLQATNTSNDLQDVYFIDATTGWTVGQFGTILKTTDGGDTWSPQISGTAQQLNSVRFVNSTIGYASGNTGTILKTMDGGDTWTAQTSGTTEHLFDMSFADSSTGYIAKNPSLNSFVLKTTNGGTDWVSITGPFAASTSAFFLNGSTGYVTGLSSPTMSFTANGGADWTTQTNSAGGLNSVYFSTADTGYACGNSSAGIRTTDAGTTWSSMTFPVSGNYRSVFFTSTTTGYIAGQLGTGSSPLIMKTTDGGTSWVDQPTGQAQFLNSIYFPDTNTGYTCGRVGLMLKTTTGGTGVKIINSIAETFLLEQNYPNPFNPMTTIKFSIPNTGFISLKVFDLIGQEVAILVNGQLNAGDYQATFNAEGLVSGLYFYNLRAAVRAGRQGSSSITKKMLLVR